MYKNYMFWLGGDKVKETKLKAKDGIIQHRNAVLNEAVAEIQKLRAHIGRVTWRDVVETIERLRI